MGISVLKRAKPNAISRMPLARPAVPTDLRDGAKWHEFLDGGVAQLVERRNHNPQVAGSIPAPATASPGSPDRLDSRGNSEASPPATLISGSSPDLAGITVTLSMNLRRDCASSSSLLARRPLV